MPRPQLRRVHIQIKNQRRSRLQKLNTVFSGGVGKSIYLIIHLKYRFEVKPIYFAWLLLYNPNICFGKYFFGLLLF